MFTVVIVPIGVREKGFANVSFLGQVLDKDSFWDELQTFKKHSLVGRADGERSFSPHSGKVITEPVRSFFGKERFLDDKRYKPVIGEIIEAKKRFPIAIEKKSIADPAVERSVIEGQAKDRSLIFKPALPSYQELIAVSGQDLVKPYFKVKMRLVIAPDGTVKAVDKLETSGQPEVDLIAIRYLKKWRFSPLSPDKAGEDQEGIVSLKFDATDKKML